MNILYIAYSCDPYNGSEDQIGWNIPLESAKSGNKVYVITKEEQRNNIEKYCKSNDFYNISFEYVDIPNVYKKIYNNFFYSGRLSIWNKKAFKIAKKICMSKSIDIIHQITPVEFRAIGNYGKIPNTKFVVGPTGGGSKTPKCLKDYSKGYNYIEFIRNFLNYQSSIIFKIKNRMKKIDYILYSNNETKNYFNNTKNEMLLTEIGIEEEKILDEPVFNSNEETTFLVAGRLIYIKGHELLFDALEKMDDSIKYKLLIAGNGKLYEKLNCRINNSNKLKNNVKLLGSVDYNEMGKLYKQCDALIMPSIRENTGTVIIEALSKGKPVIAMDAFGARVLLDENDSWLYNGETREEVVDSLCKTIIEASTSKELLMEKSKKAVIKAKNNTWESKIKIYNIIYKNII